VRLVADIVGAFASVRATAKALNSSVNQNGKAMIFGGIDCASLGGFPDSASRPARGFFLRSAARLQVTAATQSRPLRVFA